MPTDTQVGEDRDCLCAARALSSGSGRFGVSVGRQRAGPPGTEQNYLEKVQRRRCAAPSQRPSSRDYIWHKASQRQRTEARGAGGLEDSYTPHPQGFSPVLPRRGKPLARAEHGHVEGSGEGWRGVDGGGVRRLHVDG